LDHFGINEGRGEVGEEKDFIVSNFSELLHELDEMVVFNVQSPAVADHYQSWIELSDLIQEEVFYYESNEITLMVFDVLFAFKDVWKLLPKNGHPYWKDVHILIKVLCCLVCFALVEFLGMGMIVLRIEEESFHFGEGTEILIHLCFIET
jgi:hypothetical protein